MSNQEKTDATMEVEINSEDEDEDDDCIRPKFKIEDSDISDDNNYPWTDYEDEKQDLVARRSYGLPIKYVTKNPESMISADLVPDSLKRLSDEALTTPLIFPPQKCSRITNTKDDKPTKVTTKPKPKSNHIQDIEGKENKVDETRKLRRCGREKKKPLWMNNYVEKVEPKNKKNPKYSKK